jgi:hypothetical protein
MSYVLPASTVVRPTHRVNWRRLLLTVAFCMLAAAAAADFLFLALNSSVNEADAVRQFDAITGTTAIVQKVNHNYFTGRYTDEAQFILEVNGEIKIIECSKIGLLSPQLCNYNS